jgi:N-acetyl-1-D-myo-inositol-2-amino-2-deoxy-alpha-D-glucopyranoside deacetylase
MTRRLLALLAHPDDETFGPGATLARYAAEGADVRLAVATRGEAGMVGDPPVTTRECLGETRERELRAAAEVLGIREILFLGFGDGKLVDTPFEELLRRSVEAVRAFRPHVIVGFGPGGVSRHPDHVTMHRVAEAAFDAAAEEGRFPGAGAPWAVSKLYRFEVAQEIFDAWGVDLAGVPLREMTTVIDVSSHVDRKVRAFLCHRTQKKDYERILSQEGFREMARQETFVLSRARVPAGPFPEADLFAGIPGETEEEG